VELVCFHFNYLVLLGKTTLLDCLAGRKTAGTLLGNVTMNGKVMNPLSSRPGVNKNQTQFLNSYRRLIGYAEQSDIHLATTTVHEALLFAAELRLPYSVTKEQRESFVAQIEETLELLPIKDRLVGQGAGGGGSDEGGSTGGDEDGDAGLSPGQLKILTIAVELCANCPVLFCDEPSSS